MAKIFDLHSFRRSKSGQPTSRIHPDSLDGRLGRNNVQPIYGEDAPENSWLTSSRISVNAWAGLLLAIGVLCGLYLGRSEKKTTVANLKPDAQVQPGATPPPSLPARQLTKPSPIVPAEKAKVESGIAPVQTPGAVTNSPPPPRYIPVKYEATHKKIFGGCTGQLELTNSRLHFSCPKQADLSFPVASIAKAHKDGIELKSGEKYHFVIANRTRDQVEAIFELWLNRVQQLPQSARAF
ncbi:MAG TPA: hypothetical protein VE178_21315 [Silvibacterium sp.]|nr:hypothetical protein [Silvibacterium sp.]